MREPDDADPARGRPGWRASPPVWVGLPLLLLSLLAGAATERDETAAVASAPALRGSDAGVFAAPELRVVAGSADEVELIGGEDAGSAAVLIEPTSAVVTLAPGQRFTADLLLDEDPQAAGRARCGRAVALASSTGRPLPRVEERQALGGACLQLLGVELPTCAPGEACVNPGPPGDPARVAELVAAAGGSGPDGAVEAPVTRLEAAVVAGKGTRSAVAVTLLRDDGFGDGEPGRDQAVVAAYPGGEVVGTTDAAGRAVLPLPDVALRDPLPVRVSWRGVLPAGTVLSSLPSPGQETSLEGFTPFPAWLLAPVPYDLSVLVRRDAGTR